MGTWVTILAVLSLTFCCLLGMGVGTSALALLLAALFVIILVAFLIARPFLKQKTPPGS